MSEGWAWPDSATKAHYFVDGQSLCKRWKYDKKLDTEWNVGDQPETLDCAVCWHAAKKRSPK